MLTLPKALNKWCDDVDCYLAVRHATEKINGESLGELLNKSRIRNFIVENELEFQGMIRQKEYDLVLGMGPAWVISRETLKFAGFWVNINSIPLPKYMGGAHSTWQLLNGDDIGSIVFQEIGFPVDEGRILKRFDFSYSLGHNSPLARLRENSKQLLHHIEEVMSILLKDPSVSQGFIDPSEAEFWPRLSTDIHGWIDWQWTSLEIITFIHAFGDPFEGAKTELLGRIIHFKEAILIEQRVFHPFSRGIIIRHNRDESIDVVVADGIIRLNPIFPQTIELKSLKGLRLHTPFDKLEKAKKSNLNSEDM